MPVIKSYQCKEHGYFDAWDDPACPECGAEAKQVFIKPFSIKTGRTKKAVATLKQLAADYKMTNIKSVKEGESQAGTYRHGGGPKVEEPRQPRAGDAVMWGNAGNYSLQSLLGGGGPRSVKGEATGFNPKDMGNVSGPKAIPVARDPQNLTLKDAK
jgi:hypothetical protein